MSNLLKSKFLLGAMIVAIMFVGVVAFDATPAAADCSITSTLRVGSKGDQVKCLQTIVGATADGSFGHLTKAAVMAWQSGRSLVADGVVGPLTRAALLGGAVSGNFPAGCSSASGYSSTTGVKCDSVQANTFPAGCTSASGYSPTTGASCSTGAVAGQTGPVSASLASDNPASGYIIGGQATADLAHFTFSGVGTLNTVVLQRTGVSDQNTLSSVYLYDGATRLTDGYSFNNSGQLTMNSLGVAVDGVQVGTAATMGTITGSNYAMFDFAAAPVSLSTGTHTVDLRADVVKGSSYTVTASIQQASDLVLYDGQAGVNIAALGPAGVTYTANSGAEITINAGSASVTIDPTFQSLTNITGGATNVTIGKFKVHGYGEDVKVSSLVVKPAITSGTVASGVNITTLNNITVYFNGSQVGSSANYSGTALTFTLGSQMIIP